MGPEKPLPLSAEFADAETYISSLLRFSTSSELLRRLCGGVHVLDFFTRTPDLYSVVIPEDWRTWFDGRDIHDILDLLLREDVRNLQAVGEIHDGDDPGGASARWREEALPPPGLLQYIHDVKRHCLDRTFPPENSHKRTSNGAHKPSIARDVATGMNQKKVHEVDHFARYIANLTDTISALTDRKITHLVDFGSGQNYLGRVLASRPYHKRIVAIESKPHNVQGARNKDVMAKLAPKKLRMVNKKAYRAQFGKARGFPDRGMSQTLASPEDASASDEGHEESEISSNVSSPATPQSVNGQSAGLELDRMRDRTLNDAHVEISAESHGSIQYVQHRITSGDLKPVVPQIISTNVIPSTNGVDQTSADGSQAPNLMTISLHSCGNLLHHALHTLRNPFVNAVCLVGCCYNLLTERLSPPSSKHPTLVPDALRLRSDHPRLVDPRSFGDPDGFPMSERLCDYQSGDGRGRGISLNITARMMAVQAPQNWSKEDSDSFFTRHFFRALLQRIFLDRGVVDAPPHSSDSEGNPDNEDNATDREGTQPIIIGSLRKACYNDFVNYVRSAVAKVVANSYAEGENWKVEPARAAQIQDRIESMSDDEIRNYESRFTARKKELSIMWSLMAFSAGVIESLVVADRYQWLREQPDIEHAWVETVFDYSRSPRNLCIVGIKK